MDILTNKTYLNYDLTSRYVQFPVYYNTLDKKYMSGITAYLNNTTAYVNHTIKSGDSLDSIALEYYGNPTYYWIIADYNRILDVFDTMSVGDTLKIPTFSDIKYSN